MQTNVLGKTVHIFRILILTSVLVGLLSACKSYHLGSPTEIPFKSIYIKPVSNKSYAPQAQAIVSAMLRENFIQRVFAMQRWHQLQADGLTVGKLVDFHARHKLIIMSHDQIYYQKLGRLVASMSK